MLGGAETVTDWCLCETNEAPAVTRRRLVSYLVELRPSYLMKKVFRSALAFAGWKR